jgi:hypothetical protein
MPQSGNGTAIGLITACLPSSEVPGSTCVRRAGSIDRWREVNPCSATLVASFGYLHGRKRQLTLGSHDQVEDCVSRYLDLGYRTCLLDIPREAADLAHARLAFAPTTKGAPV